METDKESCSLYAEAQKQWRAFEIDNKVRKFQKGLKRESTPISNLIKMKPYRLVA